MAHQVTITVRGMTPIPWGSNEWEWRRKLAEEAQLVYARTKPQGISKSTHFAVEIVFLMSRIRIEGADLDNLAKPVLDTLFRSRYAQVKDVSLTGAFFNVDDDRVFKLTLEKRLASTITGEGADIIITWNDYL